MIILCTELFFIIVILYVPFLKFIALSLDEGMSGRGAEGQDRRAAEETRTQHIIESLSCIPETNMTLLINYPQT